MSQRQPDTSQSTSMVVPISFVVFAVLIGFLFARQQNAVQSVANAQTSLAKVTKEFCTYLVSDTTTRNAQSATAAAQVVQEHLFIGDVLASERQTERVISLFNAPATKQTAKQKQGTAVFVLYLKGDVLLRHNQAIVWQGQADSTAKNIIRSESLAAKAQTLASTLHC